MLSANYFTNSLINKDLQKLLGDNRKTAKIAYELKKLRERGAIIKNKNSHYYRVTEEGMNWLFYALFDLLHFVNPLLSMQIENSQKELSTNPSVLEKAYTTIDKHRRIIMNELGIAA